MHKMNPEVKAKWVAALRSGEYKQGRGWLRKPRELFGERKDEFCCLGVLCNIHAQEHPEIAAAQTSPHFYMGEELVLPKPVMKWAGLKSQDPDVRNGKVATVNISYLNDNRQWSFEKIADAIEEQF